MREGNAYRLASSLAIAGVVVVAVASRFHGGAEPQNLLSLPKYAANPYWKAVHLGQFLGFLLMASALILILNDLRQVSASPLATLGIVTAIVAASSYAANTRWTGLPFNSSRASLSKRLRMSALWP